MYRKRVRGWTSGRSFPVNDLLSTPRGVIWPLVMFSRGSVVVQGNELSIAITVKSDLKYGHQRDRTKCPLYRGVRIIEVGNVLFFTFLEPNELSLIERCLYYRGVHKERLDCTTYSLSPALKVALSFQVI